MPTVTSGSKKEAQLEEKPLGPRLSFFDTEAPVLDFCI